MQLWEEAPAAQVAEAFTEVLGQGDPNALADLHLAALQQAQMAAITAAGTPLMRAPTPASSAISPQPLLNAAALQGSVGMGGLGGLDAGLTPGGAWVTQTDLAASAAAAAAVGGGGAMMSLSRGGTAASPVLGQLPRGMSGVSYDGSAAESMERAAAAGGGFGRVGEREVLVCMGSLLAGCIPVADLCGSSSTAALAAESLKSYVLLLQCRRAQRTTARHSKRVCAAEHPTNVLTLHAHLWRLASAAGAALLQS